MWFQGMKVFCSATLNPSTRTFLSIVVDDLDDLFDGGPLSPLTPLEDSSDEVSDEEVPPSFKWCRQVKHGWMLLGKEKDELSGIS